MTEKSRAWCFTLNNYSALDVQLLELFACRYLVFGHEVGESGTPHLQGYIVFENQKHLGGVKKLIPKAHWERAKGDSDANYAYCTKEGKFFEKGTKPASQSTKGLKGAEAIAQRWALAKAGKFTELPPEHIKIYQYIFTRSLVVTPRDELDNEWVHGPSGCGKSRYVRDTYPIFYSKPLSKWWDGYAGEETVVIDDIDPSHGEWIGYFLKIWADHYPFNAEVKGAMMQIRPKKIIVTSQYWLPEVFRDRETQDALLRRFKIINMDPNYVV